MTLSLPPLPPPVPAPTVEEAEGEPEAEPDLDDEPVLDPVDLRAKDFEHLSIQHLLIQFSIQTKNIPYA